MKFTVMFLSDGTELLYDYFAKNMHSLIPPPLGSSALCGVWLLDQDP